MIGCNVPSTSWASSASSLLDAEMPADVFIDDNGMVREIVFDFSVPDSCGVDGGQGHAHRRPVRLRRRCGHQPTPPDQVTDVTSKLAQLPHPPGG